MSYKSLARISELFVHYEVFLVDAWGVLHDGHQLYPGAKETLAALKNAKKQVVVVSNAARRHRDFIKLLDKLGLSKGLYTDVMTSGELAWQALKMREGKMRELGNRCFYQGPARSRSLLNDLDLAEVDELSQAQFILNTGAEGNLPDASSFNTLLRQALKLGLPMICANPDQLAIRQGITGISAGAIAKAYEDIGGSVMYFGKPLPAIFKCCFKLFPALNKSEFIMLGDALATDIKGANSAGIDSLLLTAGIHHAELNANTENLLEPLFKQYQASPDYVMQSLDSAM